MLLPIPDVLTAGQVARARQILDQAEWVDGRVTAGHQSARTKDNMQLPEGSAGGRGVGRYDSLGASSRMRCSSRRRLPARVFPPLFNRYQGGQSFGTHVDNAIRQVTGHAATASAPIFPRRCFSPRPKNTMAASWWWKTPTARTASSCPPAT